MCNSGLTDGKPFSTTIRTANYFYTGADRLDITVKYAEEHPEYVGACLAPTWEMVGGLKHWFYKCELERLTWANNKDSAEGFKVYQRLLKWQSNPQVTPQQYIDQYLTLLRFRYACNPKPFIEIASMESVTMVCYCAGGMLQYCHRALAIEPISKVAEHLHRIPVILGEAPAALKTVFKTGEERP